jgi:YhcH/YjgK/YiaL family protein
LFPAAFAWIAEPTNLALADGRYAIDGERLYVMLQSGETKNPSVARLESHRRYIDIQVVLAGGETMEWAPADGLAEQVAYEPAKDIRFHLEPARPPARICLIPGEFALFYPEDAHKPCCHLAAGSASFRKAVFKVKVEA